MHSKSVLCTFIFLCSHVVNAAERPDSSLEIFQNSSSEIRSEQIAPQIRKHFMSMGNNATEKSKIMRQEILDAIEDEYHPMRFQQHITHTLDTTLTQAERIKVNAWLKTPLGKKASLAEATAMIDAHKLGIPAIIDNAKSKSIPASKTALIETMEMAAMESDLQLDLNVNQTSVSAFAANAPQSVRGAFDLSIFHSATDARREEKSSLNKSYSRSLLRVAFADFSDRELKSLISFWGSPTGTRYSTALRQGINQAFSQANRQFDVEVKTIIANNTDEVVATADY